MADGPQRETAVADLADPPPGRVRRRTAGLASNLSGVGSTCRPWGKRSECWSGPRGLGTGSTPMTGICVPQLDERRGDGRQAADLVGREAELDLIGAFVATARTDGGTMLATCEPGFGKIVLLDAASQAASRAGPPILRAAGIQFEAGTSFSGPHQLGLPAPGRGVKPSVGPRSIVTKVSPWSMADAVARRRRRSTGSHRGPTAGRLDPLSPVVAGRTPAKRKINYPVTGRGCAPVRARCRSGRDIGEHRPHGPAPW